jgi:hypothetical protein
VRCGGNGGDDAVGERRGGVSEREREDKRSKCAAEAVSAYGK